MAGESAVGTLHASRVLEEVAAEGAAHDVVECLLHKLVAILLDDLFFSLADGALPAESNIEGTTFLVLLDCDDLLVFVLFGFAHVAVTKGQYVRRTEE